jgi:hypothetical protein
VLRSTGTGTGGASGVLDGAGGLIITEEGRGGGSVSKIKGCLIKLSFRKSSAATARYVYGHIPDRTSSFKPSHEIMSP